MISSQQFVIAWFEYSIAALILLTATKWIVDRLRQPVDRVNLITLSLAVSACVPLLLAFASGPQLRLGLITNISQQSSARDTAQRNQLPTPSQLHGPESSPMILAKSEKPFDDAAELTSEGQLSQSGHASPSSDSSSITKDAQSIPSSTRSSNFSIDPWSIAAAILAITHCLAIAWFLMQWIIGRVRLASISRRASTANDDLIAVWTRVSGRLGSSITLLVTEEIAAPLVFGWLRPKVLVPKSLASGDQEALRFCLAHEWSHIRGNDLAKWMLVNWCEVLFWYQPQFWTLRRELRVCQDLIADDLAAGEVDEQFGRIQYSELLMSIAKQSMNPQVSCALGFHERSSQLSRRIKMLLTNTQAFQTRSTRAFKLTSCFLILLAAVIISSIRLSSADAENMPASLTEANQAGQSSAAKPAKDDNAKKSRAVRGRVLSATGEPVPGAKLWLPLRFEPRRTVEATSDADGKFELNCPADWISPTKRGGLWTVWAYASGHSIQSHSVYGVLYGQETKEYTLILPAESDTTFKVLSPDGEPLADVLVKPNNYQTTVAYELIPEEMHKLLSFRTDEDGLVRLPAIQQAPLFGIEMFHEQFGRQTIRVNGNKAIQKQKIQLRPVGSIQGQLIGDNPKWIKNVKLAFTTDNRDEWNNTRGVAQVVTDDKGRFEVPQIASGGPLRTYVSLDADLPVRPLLTDNKFLSEGDTLELEIPLVEAPIVRGKVVVKSTGKPVAKAEISLGYGAHQQYDFAITDDNGVFEARALPGDLRVQIIALPDGLLQPGTPWNEPYHVPENVDKLELPAIEVIGSHEVAGQLLDIRDQPLPKVRINAEAGGRIYGGTITDEDGRFKLRLPDGIQTEFRVLSGLIERLPVEMLEHEPLLLRCKVDLGVEKVDKAPMPKVDVKLDVKLVGKVLQSDKPAAGVTLKLHRETRGANGRLQYVQASETKTDASGSYSLGGITPGDKYYIEISTSFPAADPAWQHQMPYVQTLPATAKGTVKLPDVKLLKLSQSISGVVVDPDGKPVKGASIGVKLRTGEHLARMSMNGPPPWTETDQRGRFQLKELPDAPLTIIAYFANPKGGPVRNPASQEIDKNAQNIRIVLDPALRETEPQ